MKISDKYQKSRTYYYYNKFYQMMKYYSIKHYRKDVKRYYLKKGDKLSKNQIKKIKKYWKRYIRDFDINFHVYYINRNGKFDVRYIPDDIYANYIDPYFNNRQIESAFSDKNFLELYLHGFKLPKSYVHLVNGVYLNSNYKIITESEAVDILINKRNFVAKPSMLSFGGQNINYFENPTTERVRTFLDSLDFKNMIFQETIIQNEMMSKLHPQSLNTIRVMTLMIKNRIITLKPILRVVTGDAKVGNEGVGELFIGIHNNGLLTNFAFDIFGNRYDGKVNNVKLMDCYIPEIKKVKEICIEAAPIFSHFRLISWDIAINQDNEPVIIEANLNMGNIDIVQPIWGPIFSEYTDLVLDEVFLNLKNKKEYINVDVYM